MNSGSTFESLAPELLLPILNHLLDLESLDSLLRASPAAFRLFDIHGAEVFEAVLATSSSGGVTHEYTCTLIQIDALVRSTSLPPQADGWRSLGNLIRHHTTSFLYEKPQWTEPAPKLSSAVAATVLREVLATSRKITCLTVSCLKFYLKSFKALRPSHLVDKNFKFESDWYGDDDDYIPSWQQKPAEEPFQVQDIGSPTWIEEQRVIRAFWRVQLHHDLKTALGASLIRWPETDVAKFNRMPVVDLYDPPRQSMKMTGGEPFFYQMDFQLEDELIWSVIDYVKNDKQTITAPDFLQTKRDWPTPIPIGPQDLEIMSDWSSWTMRYFVEVGGSKWSHDLSGAVSPLQHISFEPFRRLGFAIWDNRRMVSYGFLDPELRYRDDSYLLAWKSILGREEVEKVERINQQKYEEAMKSEPETDSDDEAESIAVA